MKTATPTPLSLSRPTAPLPPAAAAALSRLERAFPPAEVVVAVTRYETAALRYDELLARPASSLSPAEFDALAASKRTMDEALAVLAKAGRTGLLDPARTAEQYRAADHDSRKLVSKASKLCGSDFDRMLCAVDEMGHCRTILAEAGQLDLIGGGR